MTTVQPSVPRPGVYHDGEVIYDVICERNVLEVLRDGVVYMSRHRDSSLWPRVWAELHTDQWKPGEGR
jgi:hypothetical protein